MILKPASLVVPLSIAAVALASRPAAAGRSEAPLGSVLAMTHSRQGGVNSDDCLAQCHDRHWDQNLDLSSALTAGVSPIR